MKRRDPGASRSQEERLQDPSKLWFILPGYGLGVQDFVCGSVWLPDPAPGIRELHTQIHRFSATSDKKTTFGKFRQRSSPEILEPVAARKDRAPGSGNFRIRELPTRSHRFSAKSDKKTTFGQFRQRSSAEILEPVPTRKAGSRIHRSFGSSCRGKVWSSVDFVWGSVPLREQSSSYAYQKKVFDKFSFFMTPQRCFLLTFEATLRSKFPLLISMYSCLK